MSSAITSRIIVAKRFRDKLLHRMLSIHQLFLVTSTFLAIGLCILIAIGPNIPTSELRPTLAEVSRLFITDSAFVPWNNATSERWDNTFPSNIPLQHAGLVITTNLDNGSHTWSDISLSHQLRCLIFIRREMMLLASSTNYVSMFRADTAESSSSSSAAGCFEYLRQVSNPERTATICQVTCAEILFQ